MEHRSKSALVTLIVGLALNIALGVSKLVVGVISRSSAVASDALNNLSDAAVSITSAVAVALAARAADREHPYGHGRYEYIATFILGAAIVVVGIEVFIGGVKKAITPAEIAFDTALWATLGVAIAVKVFMAVFYTVRGRLVKSDAIRAAAVDSASDAAVTGVVLVCAVVEKLTGAHIDGYASIAVAIVILVFAVRILKRTVDRLLGERPDLELTGKINAVLAQSDKAISTHDLIVHDYGAEHKIAEVDAVFPSDMSFVAVHAACDELEKRVMAETGVRLSVHADPRLTDDKRLVELEASLSAVLSEFGSTVHEVAIDDCHALVTLDVALGEGAPQEEIKHIVEAQVRAIVGYSAEISFDYI